MTRRSPQFSLSLRQHREMCRDTTSGTKVPSNASNENVREPLGTLIGTPVGFRPCWRTPVNSCVSYRLESRSSLSKLRDDTAPRGHQPGHRPAFAPVKRSLRPASRPKFARSTIGRPKTASVRRRLLHLVTMGHGTSGQLTPPPHASVARHPRTEVFGRKMTSTIRQLDGLSVSAGRNATGRCTIG
jgi:hypothetical protein